MFVDGPGAGFVFITCRASTHPPKVVEFRHRRGRPAALYIRDDGPPRLTYRHVE
jgi:hypothetical protein